MPPIHRTVPIPPSEGDNERHLELSLMGAFQLSDGAIPVVLGGSSQRLVAFVALQGRPISRSAAAYALWPDASEAQAHASLRSAIWRMEQLAREAMEIDVLEIDLAEGVAVDVQKAEALAHRLLIFDTMPSEEDMTSEAIAALSSDLLPDWYEDWAVIEAEDWRQLRLHALEALAEKLTAVGRFGDAIQAARAAISADPLRESPRAMLIRIHLAEGNQSEALREFRDYRSLMKRELGVEPTPKLLALMQDLPH
jgi:SARP family transcriptional regulator, regulator of embCAB operon